MKKPRNHYSATFKFVRRKRGEKSTLFFAIRGLDNGVNLRAKPVAEGEQQN
jgi:hypothetical protein